MIRRVPIVPTIIVVAAAAVMIALGIWQLGRATEKEALIAQAERVARLSSEVSYPEQGEPLEPVLYRRTTVTCASDAEWNPVAGTSLRGKKGWAHRFNCLSGKQQPLTVDIGFSIKPDRPSWDGGEVRGWIAPGGRVISAAGLAGLEPLSPPDPADLPNNHLAYAGQWFFFAFTALLIYALALRRRLHSA